jgi:competence protein ComEA
MTMFLGIASKCGDRRFAMKTAVLIVLSAGVLVSAAAAQSNPPVGNQSSYPSETHKMTRKEKSNTPSANGQMVDLNNASKKDIAALPGVGPDYAQTIIDARPFKSSDDLLRKKVIPQETYDQIKDRVTANAPEKSSASQ